jgi:hypothetical protein
MTRDRLAGLVAQAYLALFYNTNFLLNLSLSLTVLLPLFLAERISGTADSGQITQQVAVAVYSSFLYAIVYVQNDLIDYQKDAEHSPFKVSLLTRTGSRRNATWFIAWLTATLLASEWLWPTLGPSFVGYALLLLAVGTVHSYCSRAKPVTLFIERALRFLAPPFLIYEMSPNFVTATFLLSATVIYPLVMDSDYLLYLKTKCEWSDRLRRWSLSVYAIYYFCCLIAASTYHHLGNQFPTSTYGHVVAPIGALIMAPILLVFHFSYERGMRWVSDLLPDGLVPEGNPTYPGERKLSACQMVVTSVLVGLLAVSAFA